MTVATAKIAFKLPPGKSDREILIWFRSLWVQLGEVPTEHFSAWSSCTFTKIDIVASKAQSVWLRAYCNTRMIFGASFTRSGNTAFGWQIDGDVDFFPDWELLFIADVWRKLKPVTLPLARRMQTISKGSLGRLVPLAHLAQGRNRDIASCALYARLCEIMERWQESAHHRETALHGRLDIEFVQWGTDDPATYFRIRDMVDGRILMSGYLNSAYAGKYANGRLCVMSWRRGWERELFDEQDWLIT